MKVVVIDGQSGRMGQLFIERARAASLPCEIVAVGTNAIATSAMLKAGASPAPPGKIRCWWPAARRTSSWAPSASCPPTP